jgi:hypothetical protein
MTLTLSLHEQRLTSDEIVEDQRLNLSNDDSQKVMQLNPSFSPSSTIVEHPSMKSFPSVPVMSLQNWDVKTAEQDSSRTRS